MTATVKRYALFWLSIISVADAWQNRAQPILAQPARPAQRA